MRKGKPGAVYLDPTLVELDHITNDLEKILSERQGLRHIDRQAHLRHCYVPHPRSDSRAHYSFAHICADVHTNGCPYSSTDSHPNSRAHRSPLRPRMAPLGLL